MPLEALWEAKDVEMSYSRTVARDFLGCQNIAFQCYIIALEMCWILRHTHVAFFHIPYGVDISRGLFYATRKMQLGIGP